MFIRFHTWLLREYCEFILISNVEKEVKKCEGKNCGCMRAMRLFLEIDATDLSLSLYFLVHTQFLLPIRYRQFKYIKTLDSHSALISLFSLCLYSSVLAGDFNFFSPFLLRFVLWRWNFLEIGLNVHIAYMQHQLKSKRNIVFPLSFCLTNFFLSNVFYSLNLHDMCLFLKHSTLKYAIFSIKFFLLSFYPELLRNILIWTRSAGIRRRRRRRRSRKRVKSLKCLA